jgi:DNA-binding NarL/FixJ family response regulator
MPVLCVDDNAWIGEAVSRVLRAHPEFAWEGWFPSADGLENRVATGAAIILLDLDIPGQDSFETLRRLNHRLPDIRVVILSGHVQLELIDRAIECGAWGYISKNDEIEAIVSALKKVAAGEVAFSPTVQDYYRKR